MVSVLHKELEYKVKKLKYKKLEVVRPRIKNKSKLPVGSKKKTIPDQSPKVLQLSLIQEEADGKTLVHDKCARLLLACYVVTFTYCSCFLAFYKKICLKGSEVWRKIIILNKVIVVPQALASSFLSHPVA